MKWTIWAFAIFLLSSLAFASQSGLWVRNTTANSSWIAGSTGNTYTTAWNFTAWETNESLQGGSVTLRLAGRHNCTAAQSQWNVSGGGLNNQTNHTITLTCGVLYEQNNYNFSIIVNGSGVLGGNATNASWSSTGRVNVSVLVPVFAQSVRTITTQSESECVISPMTVSVSAQDSQALQFCCRGRELNTSTGITCDVRSSQGQVTNNIWVPTGFSCWSLGNQAASASAVVDVAVCSQDWGTASLDTIIGDANASRQSVQAQTFNFEQKGRSSSRALQQQAAAQAGAGGAIASLVGGGGGAGGNRLIYVALLLIVVAGGGMLLLSKRRN